MRILHKHSLGNTGHGPERRRMIHKCAEVPDRDRKRKRREQLSKKLHPKISNNQKQRKKNTIRKKHRASAATAVYGFEIRFITICRFTYQLFAPTRHILFNFFAVTNHEYTINTFVSYLYACVFVHFSRSFCRAFAIFRLTRSL